jgi:tetratricopeptide (TPR) repeat protein
MESLACFDQAIRTLQTVYDKAPDNVTARQFLRNSYSNRAIAYDRLQKYVQAVKDHDLAVKLSTPGQQPRYRASRAYSQLQAGMIDEAVVEVAELSKSEKWTATDWYDFGCVYSVASGKITDKKDEYARRAVEMLQRAVKAGYTDAAHMKKDTDLAPLRDREDFKKLIAELEKTPEPKK